MLDPADQITDLDILAFPETTMILLSAVIEPIRAANRIAGRTLYRWRLLSPDGRPVETTAGICIPVSGAFQPERDSKPLFVVASYNWQRSATPAIKMALSRTARHRDVIVGVESGAWLMAEASLLDDHKATVHWEDFDDFTARYPEIGTVKERYVIDRKRMTSAGAVPTLDLMLEIIRRGHGYSMALEVARSFIYERDGGGRDLLPSPPTAPGIIDRRMSEAVRLMEETVDQPLSLEKLARKSGLSARHLQSLFNQSFGVTPHVHYLALRLNAARRKVIETPASFAEIATATGFNSASAFSRSYRLQFRESPSETRKRLRSPG
ncbi:transcriptional regulator GlxA family with amidase domain [Rhizobium sp. SG_E_25_P2]|jgi:transcriptional regulator GlxA family with amidase domain|uniref:GlxA family transcriptional regulator n=1 Tax=Rhizobium sp. SG_E_25_P2 TaxID=2879942 RepID=UPI0024746A3A|nr:GlxA family transcriptional regulator [Rhizobium sp. SG_E_25_P2]MDH6265496.1 transcriptional regulator GlxA family with amidase domain [Rhizobium sp. SG_E_25_P2]